MEKVDLQDRFSNTKLTQLWLKKKVLKDKDVAKKETFPYTESKMS